MLSREDRKDLATFGLTVLLMGLLVTPVVHAVVGHGPARADAPVLGATPGHDESRPHHHPGRAPGSPHHHLDGSPEHLSVIALSAAPVLVLSALWIGLPPPPTREAHPQRGGEQFTAVMPQGP